MCDLKLLAELEKNSKKIIQVKNGYVDWIYKNSDFKWMITLTFPYEIIDKSIIVDKIRMLDYLSSRQIYGKYGVNRKYPNNKISYVATIEKFISGSFHIHMLVENLSGKPKNSYDYHYIPDVISKNWRKLTLRNVQIDVKKIQDVTEKKRYCDYVMKELSCRPEVNADNIIIGLIKR